MSEFREQYERAKRRNAALPDYAKMVITSGFWYRTNLEPEEEEDS